VPEYNGREVARNLVNAGLAVIELHPGQKRPMGARWTERPARTPADVEARWGMYPQAGVGVMTGHVSGITVLDFDAKNGGAGWSTAERILGPGWWDTVPWVLTASRTSGHVYLPHQPHWGSHSFAQLGLDIQGDGRQVVAPGVWVGGGQYTCQGPLAFLGVPQLAEVTPEVEAAVQVILGERQADVPLRDLGEVTAEPVDYAEVLARLRGRCAAFAHEGTTVDNDRTAEVQAVANALAGMTIFDGTEWLLTPGQGLEWLMTNPYTAEVADSRRGGGAASQDWMVKYALPKSFGARGLTPLDDLLGDDDGNGTTTTQGPAQGVGCEQRPDDTHAGPDVRRGPGEGASGPGGGELPTTQGAASAAGPGAGPAPIPAHARAAASGLGAGDAGPGAGAGAEPPGYEFNPATGAIVPVAAPAAAVGGDGGGVAAPAAAPVEHTEWRHVAAALQALTGRTEDQVKEGVRTVLDLIARLNGSGSTLHVEEALEELKTRSGLSKAALRGELNDARKAHRQRARDALARLQGETVASTEHYTLVEAQGRLFNHRSGQWVLPQYYAAMQGLDPSELDLSRFHRKRHDVTFVPQMPWRAGFKEAEHYSVPDPVTGLEAMNMWSLTRGPTPCWMHPVPDEAIRPWLELLPKAGVEPEVAEELYDVLAYKCQHPAVKVNRMVLLGGGQGTGKSTLLAPLAVAVGEAHVLVTSHNVLDSDFDPDVSRAVFMVCEEMASQSTHRLADGRRMYNKMKPYAAAPPTRLSVTLKGQNAVMLPNVLLAVGTTNHRDAVQMESDDRRMFMVWMKPHPDHTSEVWGRRLLEWMTTPGAHGWTGAQLVAGWLLQRDVSRFNPGARPTRTWWWHEAVEESKPPLDMAVAEAIEGLLAVRDVVTMVDLRAATEVVLRENGYDSPTVKAVNGAVRRLGLEVKRCRGSRSKNSRLVTATVVVLEPGLGERTQDELLKIAGVVP